MTDTISKTDDIMQRIGSARHGDDEPLFTDEEVKRIELGLELQAKRYALKEGSVSVISRHADLADAQEHRQRLAVDGRMVWIEDAFAGLV